MQRPNGITRLYHQARARFSREMVSSKCGKSSVNAPAELSLLVYYMYNVSTLKDDPLAYARHLKKKNKSLYNGYKG